jgi:Ser/Thr protein kinase RdoA (MazF antagonist)
MSDIAVKLSEMTGEKRLPELLEHHYGLQLREAVPVGGVLKLSTDRGEFALKRVRPGEKARWILVSELARHLAEGENGPRIPEPLPTDTGKVWFEGFRFAYVMLPWLKGEPIRPDTSAEWKDVSRELARLHLSTCGFKPKKPDKGLNVAGKWRKWWEKDLEQLNILRLAAKWTSTPTETDRAWLRMARYAMGVMENLLRYYEKIGGDEIAEKLLEYGRVNHGRLHRRNILRELDGTVRFVDWNEMTLDVPTGDLAAWLSYAYGRTGSSAVLAAILEGYGEIRPIGEEEHALIYARLLYPESLVRLMGKVYLGQSAENGPEVARVLAVSEMERRKTELLAMYADLAKQEFGVAVPEIDWIRSGVNRNLNSL